MNKDDVKVLNSLAKMIRKEGSVTKGNLYKNCNLSISKFDKIKSYLPTVFEDIVYDIKTQTFTSSLGVSLSPSLSLFDESEDYDGFSPEEEK